MPAWFPLVLVHTGKTVLVNGRPKQTLEIVRDYTAPPPNLNGITKDSQKSVAKHIRNAISYV